MADIDLNHLASQNERVLAEIARLREEMDGLRDEMNVLTAIMTRIDRWIGEQSPPLPANDRRQRHRIPEAGTRLASISTGGPRRDVPAGASRYPPPRRRGGATGAIPPTL